MQTSSTTILVTGAAGFIGQALCPYLLSKGFNVKTLLRDSQQTEKFSHLKHKPPQLQHCTGDLLDLVSLKTACAGVDVIVHLAGLAHVNDSSSEQSSKINAEGTSNLLNAAIENGVRRMVLVSSSLAQAAERGEGDITAYGQSKLAAEKMLRAAHDNSEIEAVILRPVNVYGPGMKGNIASMISLVDRGLLPPLPALNSQISLIGVDDLVQALTLAIEVPYAAGKTYTVTDGESYSIVEIERAIYHALGRKFPAWRTPRMILYAAAVSAGWISSCWAFISNLGPGNNGRKVSSISARTYKSLVSDNLFSNEQLCQELGFKPATTFYQTLPKILKADFNK